MNNLDDILTKVQRTVRKTGKYALKHKNKAFITQRKGENDFATNVDIYCEQLLIRELMLIGPNFGIYSEELHSDFKKNKRLFWVIDPIDGTKNYFRNNPLWSINVALFDNKIDKILLGVVYFPELNTFFYARKGFGAYQDNNQISVSQTSNLSNAVIYVDLPSSNHRKFTKNFLSLQKDVYRIRSWGIGSSICFVASGAFDGFIDFSGTTKAYDIYASLIIAQEAGATISEIKKGQYKDTVIWVTNSKISFDKYL